MGIIDYGAKRELLVTARGHPYQRDAFAELFDAMGDYRWSLVEQPAASLLLNPECAASFDAIVCYDMPGIHFGVEDPPRPVPPDPAFVDGLLRLLDAGRGFVFMHHSIAAWPAWPEYAEIVGGRFHYRPAELRGELWPDSGYRHGVEHTVTVLRNHPVTAGVPSCFTITDELYLCPVFEDSVIPLLSSDFDFVDSNFYSARRALEGSMYSRENWQHPPGSALVGWIKHYGNSPVVYLQCGDDPVAYANPHFRRLLHNAIRWVSSREALDWARERNGSVREQLNTR